MPGVMSTPRTGRGASLAAGGTPQRRSSRAHRVRHRRRGAVVRLDARGGDPMMHEIPAKSRLLPVIPITSRAFVYRRARETDVRVTFARGRAALAIAPRPAPASASGRTGGKGGGPSQGANRR